MVTAVPVTAFIITGHNNHSPCLPTLQTLESSSKCKEDFSKVGMIKRKNPRRKVIKKSIGISLHFGDVKNAKIYAFITLIL